MVTKEQALSCHEFHYGSCTRNIGPKGGVTEHTERWRSNGRCRTWVTRPSDFMLPIKYGLKQYSYLTHSNADRFHTAADCPLTLNPAPNTRRKRRTLLDWGYWVGQTVKTPCGLGVVQATNQGIGVYVQVLNFDGSPHGEPMWCKLDQLATVE